jgi:inorganic pyrophosphatase
MASTLADLPARHSNDGVYAVIETAKGHRNKFKFDPAVNAFRLDKVLPAGSVFPFDFGFIPSTKGEDGDPLDVLVLLDEPAPTGAVITVRLVGVIRARQTERDGTLVENHRLIGAVVAEGATMPIADLHELSDTLIKGIEHFFISYNEYEGRHFTVLGRDGAAGADRVLADGMKAFERR